MTAERRRWSSRQKLLVTLLAPLVGLLACEGILRWLLFSSSPWAEQWGRHFRRADLYAQRAMSDDYQELRYLFSPPEPRRSGFVPHPELGWISSELDFESLRHPDEERIQGRRPVLLFGSSYAACWFTVETCFQELLERSELAREYCLVNYGVTAYGLDQTVLLASKCAPRFAAQRPVVVLATVVDNDLPRGQLSFFMAPKPRFVERAGAFELRRPDELDARAYIERHRPGITSYLARYLLRGRGLFSVWSGAEHEEEELGKERLALARYCLGRAHAELEALGLEHFVVLFHSPLSLPPLGEPHEDEEPLLAYLEQQGIPYVDTRNILADECRRTGQEISTLYLHGPGTVWHPNERGTEVLFRAFQLGLEHRYDAAR